MMFELTIKFESSLGLTYLATVAEILRKGGDASVFDSNIIAANEWYLDQLAEFIRTGDLSDPETKIVLIRQLRRAADDIEAQKE